MKTKIISGIAAFALCGAMSGVALADTESSSSSQTTIEKSTTNVEVPKTHSMVKEEESTTTTKKGIFGRKKETTTSSTRYERSPDPATNAEVKSRTTVNTERSYKE